MKDAFFGLQYPEVKPKSVELAVAEHDGKVLVAFAEAGFAYNIRKQSLNLATADQGGEASIMDASESGARREVLDTA